MLKNNLKVAFRNLFKNKTYSIIGIFGFAVGLAVCLIVLQYLFFELSFDSFYQDTDSIYELYFSNKYSGAYQDYIWGPGHLDTKLRTDLPEIQSAAGYFFFTLPVYKDNELFKRFRFCATDDNFLSVFGIKLLRGNYQNCLKDPNSIILTRSTALSYFGSLDILNRFISIKNRDKIEEFKITGIIKDLPLNSSLKYDGIISNSVNLNLTLNPGINWQASFISYFLKLKRGARADELVKKFPSFINETGGKESGVRMNLIPLNKFHYHSDIIGQYFAIDPKYIYIISAAALLIFIVSLFNYLGINLALFSRRIKEIGIRKISGAKRVDLVKQFLTENIISLLFSFIISFFLLEIIFPYFKTVLDSKLVLDYSRVISPLIVIFISISIIGLLVSLYLTFFLSKIKPSSLIKGNISDQLSKNRIKLGLLNIEYIIAIFLIACTFVLIEQLSFIKFRDLGYNTSQVLILSNTWDLGAKKGALKNELNQYSNISSVTEAFWFPAEAQPTIYQADGRVLNVVEVDQQFLPTLGFSIIQGRNFEPDKFNDSDAVIINETAAREFGLKNPIGKKIEVDSYYTKYTVVGIVKDFNFKSLRDKIDPFIFTFPNRNPYNNIAVRIKKGEIKQTLDYIDEVWEKIGLTGKPNYAFLSDYVQFQYSTENNLFKAVSVSGIIALMIALLGVFALTSFVIEMKTKEIAVRRILGASNLSIFTIFSSTNIKMVLASGIIAIPAAYLVMANWLQGFAYHITLGITIFALALVLVLSLTVFIIYLLTFSATRKNPVNTLRYE
jgi:putative ABC transport system permease protein